MPSQVSNVSSISQKKFQSCIHICKQRPKHKRKIKTKHIYVNKIKLYGHNVHCLFTYLIYIVIWILNACDVMDGDIQFSV